MNLLFFILAGVGLTNLIVNAAIFDGVRNFFTKKSKFLDKLLNCMLCSGFWVGLGMGLFSDYNLFYAAGVVSLSSFVFGLCLDLLYAVTDFINLKNMESVEHEHNHE